MIPENIIILLADDDKTDCLLFKEALEELPVSAILNIVHNGEELIETITKKGTKLPDVLFLDLNMPRKNGYATLEEIKRNTDLQHIPVVIYSTTSDEESVKNVFRNAAHYYIRKPADFSLLKKVIYEVLVLISEKKNTLPLREKFMLKGDSVIIPEKK